MEHEEPTWKAQVLGRIARMKEMPFGSVSQSGLVDGAPLRLLLLTADCARDAAMMGVLARWRQENDAYFPAQFKVTLEGTTRWCQNLLIGAEDRLLFLIETGGKYVGHVGLFRFAWDDRRAEVDNVIRGEPGLPGAMAVALEAMMAWGSDALGIEGYTVRTVLENERSVALYRRVGFVAVETYPVLRIVTPERVEWVDSSYDEHQIGDRTGVLLARNAPRTELRR